MYDELITKVNAVNSSKLIKEPEYDRKLKEIEDKIPNYDKYITAK